MNPYWWPGGSVTAVTTASATSSGTMKPVWRSRFIRNHCSLASNARPVSISLVAKSVPTVSPHRNVVTRMPVPSSSRRSVRAACSTPALAAAYGRWNGHGTAAASEAMNRMSPPAPSRRIAWIPRRAMNNAPVSFVAISTAISAGEKSSSGP